MLVNTYTLPQLVDLALRVPEIGAVNFNILHTVLRTLIEETGMRSVRPWCNIENPVVAQAALTSAKLKPPPLRKSFSELFVPLDGEEFKVRSLTTRPLTADDRYSQGEVVTDEGAETPRIPETDVGESSAAEEGKEEEEDVRPEQIIPTERDRVEELEEENLPAPEMEAIRPHAPPTTGADIMTGIDQGKQSQIMSEVWRATNVNRRMDAAEEGLQKLSYVVDRIVDRLNEMAVTTEEAQKFVESIKPKFNEIEEDVSLLKETVITKEDLDAIRTKAMDIEKSKIDKTELPAMLTETVLDESPLFLDDLNEKVDYVGGAVRCILDETGINYIPPPSSMLEPEEIPQQPPEDSVVQKQVHPTVSDQEQRQEQQEAERPQEKEGRKETARPQEQKEPEELPQPPSASQQQDEREVEPPKKEAELEKEPSTGKEEVEKVEKREEPPKREQITRKEKINLFRVVPTDRPSMKYLNERFDNIWDEIETLKNLILKVEKVQDEEYEEENQKIEELELMLKKVIDDTDSVSITVENIASDRKQREHLLKVLQGAVDELKFTKAEKDDVETALLKKADKTELQSKVEREEFEATVGDLGDTIETLALKLRSTIEDWHVMSNAMYDELDLRLKVKDYETRVEPIFNRLNSLMYGFKNMKLLMLHSLYPEAAGVTKCISCGRPAELAGTRYREAGDVPIPPKKKDDDDFDESDLTPYDPEEKEPSSGERSIISLPATAISKKSSKIPQNSVHICRQCNEKAAGKVSENIHSESGASASASPTDDSDEAGTAGERSTPSHSRLAAGMKRKKSRKDTDEELEKLMRTKPSTRFCGGEHTRTKPMQKGTSFTEQQLPPRSSEYKIFRGYDNTWYRGAFPAEKEGELPPSVDPDTLDMDEMMRLCQESLPALPPRDYKEPRFCGGAHTITDPLQRGLKFTPLRLSEEPVRRQVTLCGRDGGVYKGVSDDRQKREMKSDRESVSSSIGRKPNNAESRTERSGCQSRRKTLKPAVISITMDTENMKTSDSSRVCVMDIPNMKLNRPMSSRFNSASYASTYANSSKDYNINRGKT